MNFFKRLGANPWLPWLGALPFVAVPVLIVIDGDGWRGLGLIAVFGSLYVGISVGRSVGASLNRHLLKKPVDFENRLGAAFSCFGFLFLPPVVASLTNMHLGTGIGMHSLSGYFVWACMGACFFFAVGLDDSDR